MQIIRVFADNGLPLTLPAQLGQELPECQLRIIPCKSYCEKGCGAGLCLTVNRVSFPAHSTGPGLQEGDKATSFDKALAQQSTELDLIGVYAPNRSI